MYTSVCLADVPSEPSDFFPLFVNYQERFSAAGRTRCVLHLCLSFRNYFTCYRRNTLFILYVCYFLSGGFFKREGRTKDHEVLGLTFE